jgi:deoxyribonuclease V
LATHLGLIYDTPSIGCAKSILIGNPDGDLGLEKGASVKLTHPKTGKTIGLLLRTKTNCKPMVISIGHKVSLAFAKKVILYFSETYRVPEITRQPHLLSNVIRTG